VELVYSRMDQVHGLRLMSLRASLNGGRWLTDQGPGLGRSKGYDGFESGASIGERMTRSDFGRGAALRLAAQPAHGGGSIELAVYDALNLSFR
jgi:hypothetical protein